MTTPILSGTPWEGKRVLVAGGLGFIGATLVRRLATEGADVVAMDNLSPDYGGNPANLASFADDPAQRRIRITIADLRDHDRLPQFVEDRQVVFNLAAQSSHLESMRDPLTDLDINARAALSLLDICRRTIPECRIIYASTRQVYGRPRYLPVDEKHPVAPIDANGVSKVAGEGYHLLYGRVYGMATAVLRLTNTYGPRMRIKDNRQTFLGVWIRAVLEGQPFEVWGGDQLRDLTYVDDAVDALMRLALEPEGAGGVFNLGGEATISLKDLASLVSEIGDCSFTVRAFPEERRAIDIGDFYADDRLFRAVTGWYPKISLVDGLRRTVEFYRRHGHEYL